MTPDAANDDGEEVHFTGSAVWGWASFPHPDPQVFEHHCVPLMDLGTHEFAEDCPCGAFSDCPGSVRHFAFDGREQYEQGMRKRH